MRSAPAIEKIGHRWFQAVSGVLLVEASKQIYAGTTVTEGKAVRSRRLVALPGGNAASHSRSRNMER